MPGGTGAAMFLSAPIAGRLARVLDLRVMLATGLLMFGGGLWWMADLTVDSAFWELFGPQALRGASMMLIMLPVNQIALGRLPAGLKNASGLYNLMRNLGGAVGLAMINTVATSPSRPHAASAGGSDMVTCRGHASSRQHDAHADACETGRWAPRGTEAGGDASAAPGVDTDL
jgi:hypothetical protein